MVFSHTYDNDTKEFLEREIRTAFNVVSKTVDKAWIKNVSMDSVLKSILNNEILSVISDGYLIAYSVRSPWFNDTVIGLEELLVFRLSLESVNGFDGVVYTLETLATYHHCDFINVGTALARSDRALSKMYTRHGFQEEQRGLIKLL